MSQLKQEPLVSIIIPCYNYAHFLPECFANLFLQSYTNWECIVVDNISTDNTKQVVLDFIKKDSRIKYLYQGIKGPSAARNSGIIHSEGTFIQFLDADDLLTKCKLESATTIFNANSDVDIVYSDMRYFSENDPNDLFYSYTMNKQADHSWMSYSSGKRKQLLPVLLKGNIMVISSPVIKKSTLLQTGLFNEELAYNEDWDLWLRFALDNRSFYYDDNADSMTLIRVHSNSHSRNRYKMYYCGLYVCCKTLQVLEPIELNRDFIKKIHYHEYIIFKTLCSFKSGEIKLELNKITAITGKYALVNKLVAGMPLFMIKAVLLILTCFKYIQYKFL